jgi:hypothetical protein
MRADEDLPVPVEVLRHGIDSDGYRGDNDRVPTQIELGTLLTG